jgi:hypothetical protein
MSDHSNSPSQAGWCSGCGDRLDRHPDDCGRGDEVRFCAGCGRRLRVIVTVPGSTVPAE